MRFGAMGMKRPEEFPKAFRLYRHSTTTSTRGRERENAYVLDGVINCILSIAKPEEQQRFGQMGVTVTHTIFHTGTPKAAENDVFALYKGGQETRYFRVQAIQDHGEMDVFTTYYCEERGDVNGMDN